MKLTRLAASLSVSALALCLAAAPPIAQVQAKPKAEAVKGKPQANAKSSGSNASQKNNTPGSTATDSPAGPIDTEAARAFIIEDDTGTVLLNKGGDERIHPASMSKVMTAYVVFSLLKQGRAKLDDELPVSEHAWRTGGSKMFVPINGHIKIDDLLRGMIVQSGNDACVVLAEGLAGSESAFVDMMNDKAKEIGLNNSHFSDVDGLPDPGHWMTTHDLAILAHRTIHDFPEYFHYFSEKDYGFNSINQGNRNPLLYKDIGADGMKTGHTDESGYSLLGTLHRGDRRVIEVLSGMPSMKSRAQEGERLADWAFREYNNYQLFKAGDKVDDADVWVGTDPKVPLMVDKDVVVTLSRKARKDMKVTAQYDRPLPAPIVKGTQVGKVIVTSDDMKPLEIPLLAGGDVPRMGPLGRMAMGAAHLIWGDRH